MSITGRAILRKTRVKCVHNLRRVPGKYCMSGKNHYARTADGQMMAEFVCKKCGHTNFCKGKTAFSRRCTRCKSEESATANTIFHRCHIPITEALRMVYIVCHDPEISSYELSRQLEKRQMTCWKLKSKLMECIEKRGEIDILYK